MVAFVKKYWVFMVLTSLAVVLFFARYTVKQQDILEPKGPTPSWNDIVPGKTKISDAEQRLGKPSSQIRQGSKTLHTFPLEEGGPPHKVVVENETIELIKEQYYGEQKLNDFKTKYGEPKGEFFGPYESMGFKVFVFPENGITTVSSIGDGTVIEIWYFEPTTLSNFLQRWGQNLRTEPSGGRF